MDHEGDAPIPDPYLPRKEPPPETAGEPGGGSLRPSSKPADASDLGPPRAPFAQQAPAGPPLPVFASFQAVPASPYATWALVVGMLGLICFGAGPILGVIAMVLGVLGWRQIAKAGGTLRGRLSAGAGIAAGFLGIVFFVAEVAIYLTLMRPRLASNAVSQESDPPRASPAPSDDDPSASSPGAAQADPPPTTSTVTTVGNITVVDVAIGVTSLSNELRQQHAEAAAHGERLLLETTAPSCAPCQGVASSLGDPRMQAALDHVRLVRVDRDPFEEDLAELEIPSRPFPGFFLLDSDLRVTDGINGGEWDDDIAVNIAPVLGPFVRGGYAKRRTPWKKLPRPGGTVL